MPFKKENLNIRQSSEKYSQSRFLHPLSNEIVLIPENIRIRAIKTLEVAMGAVSIPSQSNYFVKCAVSNPLGLFGSGGNKESWAGKAEQHGETAAIDNFYQVENGQNFKGTIDIMAFWTEEPILSNSSYATSCGDCRDVMKEHCDVKNGYIFDGNPQSGIIQTIFMKDLFIDHFKASKSLVDEQMVSRAIRAYNRASDGLIPPDRKSLIYGVSGKTASGKIIDGVYVGQAGFHPLRPINGLVSQMNALAKTPQDYIITDLTIACDRDIPFISYADRQILDDHRSRQAQFGVDNIKITVTYLDKGRVYRTEETNAKEWLPMAFSLSSFGMDHVMENDLKKMFPSLGRVTLGSVS